MSKGRIIGIISLKGGVGKTTMVANLGAALATEFKKQVLVIDANFSAPNLGLHLGLVNPEVTLHDVLLNQANLNDAIYEHEGGFHVIPSSFVSRKVSPYGLKQKISYLKDHYDMILIDSSPSLNEEILATMIASDELIVVTNPDYPTLSTTLKAIRLAKQRHTPIVGLVLNRVRHKKFELTVKDIEDAAGVPIIGILPEDLKIPESIYNTKPVCMFKPKSKSSVEFKRLAGFLIGESYKDPRFSTKFKSWFNFKKR